MEFAILGPTKLITDGVPLPLGAAKQRGMLALLLLRAEEPVRVDTLIDHLWEDPGRGDHRQALYTMASRLRAALGQAGLHNALVRIPTANAYRLDIAPSLVDYHQFRSLVSEARAAQVLGDHDGAAAILWRAIEIWRGEPLADLSGARIEHLRAQLNDSFLEAHKLLADSRLRTGQHFAVLAQLENIIHDHQLDEALARSWIRALCAADRADEARRYFADFRRRFRKAMRVEPDITLTPVVSLPAPPPPGRPRQLPPQIKDFIGREATLDEMDTLTAGTHAVTNAVVITGMPGVGKTALALRWSHRHLDRFPDGQLYLNAGAYGPKPPVDPHDALARFLEVLGVAPDRLPHTLEQRRELFNETLDDRRVLVVLDNVLDPSQARPLIPQSDTCVTVLTSRIRLSGLTIQGGARNITIPPLSGADSTQLLTHLVGPVRTAAEPQATQSLVQIAAGLPLALRIVGEKVAERPRAGIADLARELQDRLLDSGGDDDEDTKLTTVFAWSYQALPPAAARMFRRLSHHPGSSISTEAAAVTEADIPTAEKLLNTLAKAHLLDHDTARRYRFHDLLHLYAATRAAAEDSADEIAGTRRAIYDWYLLSAANAATILASELPAVPDLPDPARMSAAVFATADEALNWYEREAENLMAVTQDAARHGFDRHAWQIPGATYEIFDREGRHDDIVKLNQIAVRSARRDRHIFGEIGSLANLGSAYFSLHDYRQAIHAFAAARDQARLNDQPEAEAACAHNLATTQLSCGETDQAIATFEHIIEVCRRTANQTGEAAARHRLGDAYRQKGHYERAAETYLQALDIKEQIGWLRGQATVHNSLAALYLETKELALAAGHSEAAIRIGEHTRDEAAQCDSLTTMAEIQGRDGRADEASLTIHTALRSSEKIGDSYRRARALTVLAELRTAAGRSDEAAPACAAALQISTHLEGTDAQKLRDRITVVQARLS